MIMIASLLLAMQAAPPADGPAMEASTPDEDIVAEAEAAEDGSADEIIVEGEKEEELTKRNVVRCRKVRPVGSRLTKTVCQRVIDVEHGRGVAKDEMGQMLERDLGREMTKINRPFE